MDSPFKEIWPTPSATSTPGGVYDKNPAPAFGNPRSPGGLPVKMQDTTIGPKPGALDSPFTTAIELNQGASGSAPKSGTMDSPFKDGNEKK